MEILQKMREVFEEKFGAQDLRGYFSPGRVNLLGDHTDYNGGHVFSCAISLGTYALAAKRSDKFSRVYSMNLPETGMIEFPMQNLAYDEEKSWANYLMGVVDVMEKAGHCAACGFDILIYGTLPYGAGLSSSASIEVLMAYLMEDAFKFGISSVELAVLAQRAENEFIGMNCGIMDSFAVAMGKEDCAILLNCHTLSYRYSNLDLDDTSIVITNTNKKRKHVGAAYNDRRREAESALREIQEHCDIKALCELLECDFNRLSEHISDPVARRRGRHAVYENQRTIRAVDAFECEDLLRFGELMKASHRSLRDDYEVTGKELDLLAELAWRQEGVIGSCMTGDGFGGCTVSLVKNDAIPAFKNELAYAYESEIGYPPSFYVVQASNGTRRLALNW